MAQQYGRTFMQNFAIDDQQHRDHFLGYTDTRLDEGNSEYQQLVPQDEAEVSTDLQLIYDMVDVMAARDEARKQGYDEFVQALDDRVQRFFADVRRISEQGFEQLSNQATDNEEYDDHLEELQDTVYDTDEDDINRDEMEDGLRDLGLDDAAIENVNEINDIELEIQDAATYGQLRNSLQRLADAQRRAMQSVSSSYDDGFWDDVADTAEATGVLDEADMERNDVEEGLGALTDDEIPEDELDASVFGMLKHRLYMKVAPLPDSDEAYLG